MPADFARQRQQLECHVEVDGAGVGPARHAGALGLFPVHRLAQLHIGAEASRAQRHFETALRVDAEHLGAGLLSAVGARHGERAGIAALRIVRAADEGAEFAELE
jgi:hypothetical protein